MTYEIYRYIFIGAAVLCGIMLITSVLLFILLKIPSVIGNLNGSTAKKAIENIRNRNESSENKGSGYSYTSKMRSKAADKTSSRRSYTSSLKGTSNSAVITEENPAQPSAQSETTLLASGRETSLLSNETVSNIAEKSVLSQNTAFENGFQIIYDITYIHTDEIIPAEVN